MKEEKTDKQKKGLSFFVFFIGNGKYAVPATDILELVDSKEISRLPFVPSIVEGVINFEENAVTIVNLSELGLERVVKNHFLIFKDNEEFLGIRFSEMERFYSVEENFIERNDNDLFCGKIKISGEEIPLINPRYIKIKLRERLGYK